MRTMLRLAMSLRPETLVVSELRDESAEIYITILGSDLRDSMSTVNARSAPAALRRLTNLMRTAPNPVAPEVAASLVASSIDLVIGMSRLDDGRRVLSSIDQLSGSLGSKNEIETVPLYKRERSDEG